MGSPDIVTQTVTLRGVRGWLLVLCLYLMVLVPLLALLGLVGVWQSSVRSAMLANALGFEAALELALAAFGFYAGLALVRQRPNAPSIAKVYFITMLTLGVLGLGIVLMGAVSNFSDAAVANQLRGPATVATLRQILLSGAWLLYLERSLRVRGTYPSA
jgi:hypothetical protein